MSQQLSVIPPGELVRQSTDIAGLCKEIVLRSSVEIEGRKYVRVEGWQSIATAHGCVASACNVKRIEGGYVATGEIRRMQDGSLICSAEGFVGEDETTWFGGEGTKYNYKTKRREPHTFPKRADYAIRAMCQTRAISRACRSAFAHVVVLMDAGLSTTPAEEVPDGGFNDAEPSREETLNTAPTKPAAQSTLTGLVVKLVSLVSKPDAAKQAWQVVFDGGEKAGTFDAEIARRCGQYLENERKVDVTLQESERVKGSYIIVAVEDAP
tara:strand:- start:906 stop:1706 length:801 start_codon:yes stop_codon:yes gene_type:complete